MDNIAPEKESMALPIARVIRLISEHRNGIIKRMLIDENLVAYFKHQYNRELSNIRKEFLNRDLQELLTSPLDLVHYAPLIKEIAEKSEAGLIWKNDGLFYAELQMIFKKYCY